MKNTLASSLAAAALDMVSMVNALDREEDIESPPMLAAVETWTAVHGTQPAVDTLAEFTDAALVALEQAIGLSAQWVGTEMGGEARERFLVHLRTELLSDDGSPAP